MPNNPTRLFDPEVIVPSHENVQELDFWMRMLKSADEREPRVGPATMRALDRLVQAPPKVDGLADRDFWTIVGKFISRGLPSTSMPHRVCGAHLMEIYKPSMGASDNAQRLIEDIQSVESGRWVAVDTVEDCWPEDHRPGCIACDESGVSYLYGSDGNVAGSPTMARVWRRAYKDEHASDFTQLESFATHMFPNIEFSEGAWKRLKSLSGAPQDITSSLIEHLGVLNDNALPIWKSVNSTEDRQSAMNALGVTCSPEGPRIHKDKRAMRARDFTFLQGVVRCEWHTKLRPNIDRIYFAVSEGKVLVGLIVDHL